jgi:CheY-like chemotaxis protein
MAMFSPAFDNHRILIVEDDLATREALALFLATEGYHVSTAPDGLAALQQLRNGEHPSLIVLDLMMPVMDGWQFRSEQQADPALADIPVIVCSAGGRVSQRAASLEALAYFDKPVEPTELLAVIHRCCPPPVERPAS